MWFNSMQREEPYLLLTSRELSRDGLVPSGAIVLDAVVIESEVMIGAGSLVPPGKVLESGYLYVGSPVKQARPLSEKERAFLQKSANNYVQNKNDYLNEVKDLN